MADRVRKASYCYLMVSDQPGQGEGVLGALKDGGVDLIAFSAFPAEEGKAQIDLVADSLVPIHKIARKRGWTLSKPKHGFVVEGKNRPGAIHKQVKKLAEAKINVTAADAVCAGKGRYGMILWVKAKDYNRAARVLGAK